MTEQRPSDPAQMLAPNFDPTRRRLMGSALAAMTAGTLVVAPGVTGDVARGAALQTGDHVQAVVSAHRLATDAGVAILDRGGSAADAAIAVAATLSVVEPWFSSALGGGT